MKNLILYQGKYRLNNYFEGWYFKFVDNKTERVFAVIPGISKNIGDPHSFIQINDSIGITEYFRFNIDDIKFSESTKLEITIQKNFFSMDRVILNLPNVKADLNLTNNTPYNGIWPNIMGPFSYIPFMQCYHGLVTLNSRIDGEINVNNEITSFDNGKGYIEKDWGSGFPKEWIWLQGNSFKEEKTSVMLSLAHIPWVGRYFPGFLGFINIDNKTHYFSTYNNSKIEKIIIGEYVEIQIKKRQFQLNIIVTSSKSGILKAPINGSMDRSIRESVNATIDVQFFKSGKTIYEGSTKGAGLEVVGEIDKLFKF